MYLYFLKCTGASDLINIGYLHYYYYHCFQMPPKLWGDSCFQNFGSNLCLNLPHIIHHQIFLSGTISTAPYLPTGLKLPRQSCFLFICSSKTVSRDYSTKLSVATLAQHSHSDRLCPQLIHMQIMQCLIHMQIPPPLQDNSAKG